MNFGDFFLKPNWFCPDCGKGYIVTPTLSLYPRQFCWERIPERKVLLSCECGYEQVSDDLVLYPMDDMGEEKQNECKKS
jgi:hypothetical protein